ncbi:MAG: ATP synthase subunit alpha [Candidatus Parcubacteria bacterium]|nr:MAG: ATP synthase subunit alpha [Candidatus Parcubacteria bacterium]
MEDIKFLIEKLKNTIENIEVELEFKEIGRVISINDGIVWIEGLNDCQMMEILKIEKEDKEILLLAMNLEEGILGAVCLNDFDKINSKDIVYRTKRILSIPVSNEMLGRVFNPLIKPLDNLPEITSETFYRVEKKAPGVIERQPVNTPLHTGIKIIDALIPIGRGQRQLILGDRQTGKTSIALDVILNQKNDVYPTPVCIYVAIGQKMSKIKRIYEILREKEALDYSIIIATTPDDYPILLYLAPYVGCAIGEYFMDQGRDAVVIYDDLTKHAWSWREISLLLKRPVGREAYPGDIFYIHSKLLERAANLKNKGSLTALPICETQLGDISSYIPTNLISITDGQIYLEADLFRSNFKPAINIGLSVSRVGSKAQTKIIKKIAGKLKLDLAQYRELEEFAQISTDLPKELKEKLIRGRILIEILKQENLKPITFEKLAILIYAANNGFFDNFEIYQIKKIKEELFDYFELNTSQILEEIKEKQDLDEKLENKLKEELIKFFERFN